MDDRDDKKEGTWRGIGVVLSGHRIGYHRAIANKGLCEEVAGNNNGIYSRETNIRNFYRHRADGEFH